MSPDVEVRASSGNIFKDMGMPNADERLAKAELARMLRFEMRVRGLSDEQTARLLGIGESDLANVVRGRLARFSIDRLVDFQQTLRDQPHAQV